MLFADREFYSMVDSLLQYISVPHACMLLAYSSEYHNMQSFSVDHSCRISNFAYLNFIALYIYTYNRQINGYEKYSTQCFFSDSYCISRGAMQA